MGRSAAAPAAEQAAAGAARTADGAPAPAAPARPAAGRRRPDRLHLRGDQLGGQPRAGHGGALRERLGPPGLRRDARRALRLGAGPVLGRGPAERLPRRTAGVDGHRDRPGRRGRPEERRRQGRRRRRASASGPGCSARSTASLRLPLDGGKVAWNPSLTFPGLATDERVGRRLTVGPRAAILAKHGVAARDRARSTTAARPSAPTRSTSPAKRDRPIPMSRRSSRRRAIRRNQAPGVSGLELAFNARLSGQPGGQLLAVKEGTPLPDVPAETDGRVLATASGTPGQPVRTTIDPRLQSTTVNALGGQSGGVVVLNARNGNVLALAGSAYSSPQPPGSTFKVITTTAALEGHDVKLTDTFPPRHRDQPGPATPARASSTTRTTRSAAAPSWRPSPTRATPSSRRSASRSARERLVDTAEDYGFNQTPSLYNASATAATQPNKMTIPSAEGAQGRAHEHRPLRHRVRPGQGAGHAARDGVGGADRRQRRHREPDQHRQGPEPAELRRSPVEVTSQGERARAHRADARRRHPGNRHPGGPPRRSGRRQDRHRRARPQAGPAARRHRARRTRSSRSSTAGSSPSRPANKPKLAIAVMLIDASGDGGTTAAPIAREILGSAL